MNQLLHRIGFWLVLALSLTFALEVQADETKLSFDAHTGFINARFKDDSGATLALAGRSDDGTPMLALLQYQNRQTNLRELALPSDAVAIDSAPFGNASEAIFILCAERLLVLDSFDAMPRPLIDIATMYRGRSFAEMTSNVDFARDITGDGYADFLVQDFDGLHVFFGPTYTAASRLALASTRRGYERAIAFRPARIAGINNAGQTSIMSIRGNTLLQFDVSPSDIAIAPRTSTLPLGLSNEFEIEAFYNGYDSIDQSEIVLRETELLLDMNADGIPDLVTLETRSTGVFDKESTYRVHNGRADEMGINFSSVPDSVLSSRGFQFGLRAERIDGERFALISPGIKIGIRTIIGALFSRSVTLQIAIYAPDAAGLIPAEPSTIVRTKISFDFGSGSAEFPTIEFGDIDGDGLNDLLLKRRGDELVWRRNIGNGQFEKEGEPLAIEGPADGTAVTATDLDGDNRAEVIVRYARADGDVLDRQVQVQTIASDPE